MSNDRFRRAMGHVDDQLLDRYEAYAEKLPRKKRLRWIPLAAVAACLVLVLQGTLPFFSGIPFHNDPMFTAEELMDMYQHRGFGGETTLYNTYHAPCFDQLYTAPVPNNPYVPVYEYNQPKEQISKEEVLADADKFQPALAKALGYDIDTYDVKQNDYDDYVQFSFRNHIEGYSIWTRNDDTFIRTSLYNADHSRSPAVSLNGIPVQIDHTQTDRQIIASLTKVRRQLSRIFKIHFPDAKVVRKYYSDYTTIDVYFYDADATPLNDYFSWPCSEYIRISFTSHFAYDDPEAENILDCTGIDYCHALQDENKTYTPIAYAKRISLEEAEIMLRNGHIFTSHICKECALYNEVVEFSDYDHVAMIYKKTPSGHESKILYLPFYAFYKKIDTTENGLNIYAEVLVPAIQISGWEDYFLSQEEFHK